MINTESFVLYESVYKQFEILKKRKPEVATDFIEAIMEFGLYGVIPDEESDIWLYGFEQAMTSIERAKTRYNASIENGKKGGRPSKNLDQDEVLAKKAELKTWKAVASFYGISEDTLRKIRASWCTVEPEKPKNLNDNENENENENDNENENINDNDNECERDHTSNPTLSEIISYGSSMGANQDYCERFYNHYESIGWINANGLKIKNWKLVLSNWYKKDLESGRIKIDNRRRLD